VTFN